MGYHPEDLSGTGIYIHVPFCRKACNYCNFHFVTSLKFKAEMIAAMVAEIKLQAPHWNQKLIKTVYFGGGTPSLLSAQEINSIWDALELYFDLSVVGEVTLEANPDDLSEQWLSDVKNYTRINRLSIGIQSFFETDLQFMGRAHDTRQAHEAIELAYKTGFLNISSDLIYGLPADNDEQWQHNMELMFETYRLPHVSCYALTLEPGTPLAKQTGTQLQPTVWDETALRQLRMLQDYAKNKGYDHYEISNLARDGAYAQHNSAYWYGQAYLGIGPAAHSFDGENVRSWNVANNAKYMRSIAEGAIPSEVEKLSALQRYNESVMTRLRTIWGLHPEFVSNTFDQATFEHFTAAAKSSEARGWTILKPDGAITLTPEGMRIADTVAVHFFLDAQM